MTAMREVVERELARAQKQKPSYADFYARLLREQYQLQKARSLEYRIERAKLPERWALETFPFQAQPGVHEPTIKQFAELDFVAKKENIVFVGPTGTGKSGLASALLLKALENGYRGLFVRAQDPEESPRSPTRSRSRSRSRSRCPDPEWGSGSGSGNGNGRGQSRKRGDSSGGREVGAETGLERQPASAAMTRDASVRSMTGEPVDACAGGVVIIPCHG